MKTVKRDMSAGHPELRKGEVFLGNHHKKSFDELPHKSKRAGNIAYDDRGNPLNDVRYFPAFAIEEEHKKLHKKS